MAALFARYPPKRRPRVRGAGVLACWPVTARLRAALRSTWQRLTRFTHVRIVERSTVAARCGRQRSASPGCTASSRTARTLPPSSAPDQAQPAPPDGARFAHVRLDAGRAVADAESQTGRCPPLQWLAPRR